MKIAFLILHYNTIEDTIRCVQSIQKHVKSDCYEIVIVDNASSNHSGKQLFDLYQNAKHITVILNDKNLGFANGNNVGFDYIHQHLKVDFIAMINNDTYLLHDHFLELVEKEYQQSKFAVLGPKILLPNHRVNLIQKELITLKEAKSRKKRYWILYLTNLLYVPFLYDLIKKWYLLLFKKKKSTLYIQNDLDIRQEDVVLHGSFLIFSKEYFEKFVGIDPRTYMYLEEKILAVRLRKHHLKSVYNPEIEIFHNEDSATNSIQRTKRSKKLFIYKHAIQSSKILISELSSLEASYEKR